MDYKKIADCAAKIATINSATKAVGYTGRTTRVTIYNFMDDKEFVLELDNEVFRLMMETLLQHHEGIFEKLVARTAHYQVAYSTEPVPPAPKGDDDVPF